MAANEVSILTNPYATQTQRDAIVKYQQQQALAAALQQQGLTPIDTNNRMAGRIMSKVGALEPVNKLAQALLGTYGQKQALDSLNSGINPAPQQAPTDQGVVSAPTSNAQALGNALQPQQPPQLPPNLQSIGLRNPEILDKAMADNYFADHRAGATYRDPSTGQVAQAPTDQMQNFGPLMQQWQQKETMLPGQQAAQTAAANAAVQNMPVGQLAGMAGIGGQQAAPQTPPQMPPQGITQQPLPPMPQPPQQRQPLPMPPPPSAFSGTPAMQGLPSNGQPMPAVAPVSAAAGNQGVPPSINPAFTSAQNDAALKAWQAGEASRNEAVGKATGEAQKGEATIDSRFDNSQAILQEMRRLAPMTSGGPSATIMEPLHRTLNDKTSANNANFENLASNQLTTALAPIVQGVGGRIDIPLMRAIQEAESVGLGDSTKGKQAVIDNLSKMLEVQRQNAHNLTDSLTGNPLSQQQSPMGAPSTSGFKYLGVKNGNP